MNKKSIVELKRLFSKNELSESMIHQLRKDERKGVQQLIKSYDRKIQKERLLIKQFDKMTAFEKTFYEKGYRFIAGVDEAGRGPLAGPVVAASIILPFDFTLYGLTDSKLLSEQQRLDFYHIIKKKAIAYDVSIIDNHKIDDINILEATKLAMTSSLNQLTTQPELALIDAVELSGLKYPTEAIIKGDQKSIAIAAASILAKVTRDEIMKEIHKEFPNYQFSSNMGYGTSTHITQLRECGISPYHRKSFAPVRDAIIYNMGG